MVAIYCAKRIQKIAYISVDSRVRALLVNFGYHYRQINKVRLWPKFFFMVQKWQLFFLILYRVMLALLTLIMLAALHIYLFPYFSGSISLRENCSLLGNSLYA